MMSIEFNERKIKTYFTFLKDLNLLNRAYDIGFWCEQLCKELFKLRKVYRINLYSQIFRKKSIFTVVGHVVHL